MRQLTILETKLLKILFILAVLPLTGCNPKKFQANNSGLSISENVVKNSAEIPAAPEVVVKPAAQCELTATKTKLNIGDHLEFKLTTNFEIPKNSRQVWSGKSFDVELNIVNQDDIASLMSYGLSYQVSTQAGIHKRQFTLNDSTGSVICQSNLLKIEFTGDIEADKTCTDMGGHLTGPDSETCKIGSWTLYRAMQAKGLVNPYQPTNPGGTIGMADPSSIHCNSIKGKYELSDGSCNIDKYSLWYKNMNSGYR